MLIYFLCVVTDQADSYLSTSYRLEVSSRFQLRISYVFLFGVASLPRISRALLDEMYLFIIVMPATTRQVYLCSQWSNGHLTHSAFCRFCISEKYTLKIFCVFYSGLSFLEQQKSVGVPFVCYRCVFSVTCYSFFNFVFSNVILLTISIISVCDCIVYLATKLSLILI